MSEVELAELLRNGCVCSSEFGKCTRCTAADTIIRLLKERDEARQQRNNWEETAAQFCRNSDHHREKRETAEAQVAALRENLKDQTNYSIDLQRIVEALCGRRTLEEPKTTARFHYDMARKALEASR